MVLSRKNPLSKKKETDSGFLSLTLKLHEILQGVSGSSSYSQIVRVLTSHDDITRVAIFRPYDQNIGGPLKFQCLEDSSKTKVDTFIVLKKGARSGQILLQQTLLCSNDLTGDLNGRLTDQDWVSSIQLENSYIVPIVSNEIFNGFLYVELDDSVNLEDAHGPEMKSFLTLCSRLLFNTLDKDVNKRDTAFKDWLFESFSYPVFLIDTKTKRILKANNVIDSSFNQQSSSKNVSPASLISLVEAVVDKVNSRNPLVWNRGYLPNLYGDFYVVATIFGVENKSHVYAVIVPANDKQLDFIKLLKKLSKGNLLAEAATKQLYWDRLIRQVVARLHSSLDANMILQLMVDNVGQCLNASRCLFIKSDSDSLLVTHEYTDPSISPLGFGRTARFPEAVVNLFRNGPLSLSDVTSLRLGNTLASSDVSSLLNNGISSLAGAPVVCGGVLYGVLIVIELGENREWTSNELEMIRLASRHCAIAIELSMEHQKIKDQLYQASTIRSTDSVLGQSMAVGHNLSDSGNKDRADIPHLSERELEVLRLIASGLSNKEIAGRLFLTASTVELHASRMRKKLKMKSRTQLVKYACDHGLV